MQTGKRVSERANKRGKSVHVPRIDPFDSKWALRALCGRFQHSHLYLSTNLGSRMHCKSDDALPKFSHTRDEFIAGREFVPLPYRERILYFSRPFRRPSTGGLVPRTSKLVRLLLRFFTNRRASTARNAFTNVRHRVCPGRNLSPREPRNHVLARFWEGKGRDFLYLIVRN